MPKVNAESGASAVQEVRELNLSIVGGAAKLGETAFSIGLTVKAGLGAKKEFRTTYPHLVHQQYERQNRILARLRGEGSDDGDLHELTALHDKLGRLVNKEHRREGDTGDDKPFFHSSASNYSERFIDHAARLAGPHPSVELGYLLADAELALLNLRAGNLDRIATAPDVASRTLGVIGKALDTGELGMNLAKKFGDAAVHIGAGATKTFEHVAGPITVASSGFAAGKKAAGAAASFHRYRYWDKVREALPEVGGHVPEKTRAAMREDAQLNKTLHKLRTATGAAGTTVKVLGGVAAATTMACPIAAASAAVLVPTGLLIKAGDRQIKGAINTFEGKKASGGAKLQSESHRTAHEIATHGLDETIALSARRYDQYREAYATHKLASLLLKVFADEESDGRERTGEQRQESVRRLIDPDRFSPGRKSLTQGTTARDSDIEQMNERLDSSFPAGLLGGPIRQARAAVLQLLMQHDRAGGALNELRPKILEKWLDAMGPMKQSFSGVRHLIEAGRDGTENISDQDVMLLRLVNPEADRLHIEVTLRYLVRQMKVDDHFLRNEALKTVGVLAMTRRSPGYGAASLTDD